MDIKEYIASGIIESYVLGQVTDQERREVECMSSIYPEIKRELSRYQEAIEKVTTESAIQPPKELKSRVLSAVHEEIEKDKSKKVKPISKTIDRNNNSVKLWKYVAAASLVLFFIGSTIFWSNYTELKGDNRAYLSQIEGLEKEVEYKSTNLKNYKESFFESREKLAELTDKNTVQVNLAGTDLSSSSNVSVFWNKDKENVYLKVNDLPDSPSEKQYQLWAIVDGIPTDMGVLPLDLNTEDVLKMPKSVGDPAAFAITLEDKGGKPEPNLEALYVIGEVKS